MKSNQFRVLGSELGETDGYLNVVVDGIDSSGTIYFVDADGTTREWSLSSEKISELMDENLMLNSGDVVKHALWDRVAALGVDIEQNVTNNFAKDQTKKAQKELFLAAFEETR